MQTYEDAIAMLREGVDPVVYARRVGIDPDPWQASVLRSRARRIAMCCARQVGKSTITGILLGHTAEMYPGSLSVLVSPSLDQSLRLFKKVHGPINASGAEQEKDVAREVRLKNGSEVVALSGNPKTNRGFDGVDLLVIDEAAYAPRALFDAVMPFILVSKGRVIVLSTPAGKDGVFWESWNNPNFEKYKITAYDCPRISAEDIDDARGQHDDENAPVTFKRDFLAEFTDPEDAVVGEDDIEAMWTRMVEPLMDEDDDIIDPNVEPLYGQHLHIG